MIAPCRSPNPGQDAPCPTLLELEFELLSRSFDLVVANCGQVANDKRKERHARPRLRDRLIGDLDLEGLGAELDSARNRGIVGAWMPVNGLLTWSRFLRQCQE